MYMYTATLGNLHGRTYIHKRALTSADFTYNTSAVAEHAIKNSNIALTGTMLK